MDNKTIHKLIEKYLKESITPEEEAALIDWYNTAETNYTTHLNENKKRELAEDMFAVIQKRTVSGWPQRRRILGISKLAWMWSAAAIVLLALTVPFALQQRNKPVLIRTAFGETKSITLPDSSQVILNGNSTITYTHDREIWLDGEAFFNVAKKANRQRFMVHFADTVTIEVLGTEFNVYARKNESKIALKSGKINLIVGNRTGMDKKTVNMSPNQIATLRDNLDFSLDTHTEDELKGIYSWQQGRIRLAETSLEEVFKTLEETHGIYVMYANPHVKRRKASGSIQTYNQLNKTLNNIAALYEVHISPIDLNHYEVK